MRIEPTNSRDQAPLLTQCFLTSFDQSVHLVAPLFLQFLSLAMCYLTTLYLFLFKCCKVVFVGLWFCFLFVGWLVVWALVCSCVFFS